MINNSIKSLKAIIHIIIIFSDGGFNRLALGPREGNVAAPRRASLPQETALGNLLGNILSLTSMYISYMVNNMFLFEVCYH